MTPTRFVLIGVGLFLVMTLVAFFARDETVETDLHNRIQLAVLQEPNVAFEVDHLDVELTGHVTSATHRDELQSQVAHIYGIGRVSNSSMTVVPNPPVRSLPIDSEPFTPAAPVEDLPDPTLQPEPIDQLPDRSKTSAIMNPVSGENGQAQEGQATEGQPLPNAEGSVTADPITNDAAPGNVPSSQKNTEEQTELTIQPSNDSDSELRTKSHKTRLPKRAHWLRPQRLRQRQR